MGAGMWDADVAIFISNSFNFRFMENSLRLRFDILQPAAPRKLKLFFIGCRCVLLPFCCFLNVWRKTNNRVSCELNYAEQYFYRFRQSTNYDEAFAAAAAAQVPLLLLFIQVFPGLWSLCATRRKLLHFQFTSTYLLIMTQHDRILSDCCRYSLFFIRKTLKTLSQRRHDEWISKNVNACSE